MSSLVHSPSAHTQPGELKTVADRGPIRILCDEIGFAFDQRLECRNLLVAFVAELVFEIERHHEQAVVIAPYTGTVPPESSAEAIALAKAMLSADDPVAAAGALHDRAHELNPEDAYPTNHTIDMLSSCASAIRFGLETPCRSRHAASAANHVWKQVYGVRRFDGCTPAWSKDWTRQKLQAAIIGLMKATTPASSVGTAKPCTQTTQGGEG